MGRMLTLLVVQHFSPAAYGPIPALPAPEKARFYLKGCLLH
jgi:hypothetical protein